MNRTITYIINEKNENQTIGQFLKIHGYSHPIIVGLKKTTNGILLNERWVYVSNRMKKGDVLTINIEETASNSKLEPVFFPLDIVYEDDDLLIVNKTSNMPIHPSMGNYENTLANALAYYFKDQDSPFIFRCINRLGPGYHWTNHHRQKCPKCSNPWSPSFKSENPPYLPCDL